MRNPISDLRRLRGERIDWLLSVLAGVLTLIIFVFAPLQAMGINSKSLVNVLPARTATTSTCASRPSIDRNSAQVAELHVRP
jgi:hypothetical protein